MQRRVGILLTAIILTATAAFADSNYSYTTPQPQTNSPYSTNYSLTPSSAPQSGTLKGRVVTVPAGETFKAVVTTPLNSANLALGQSVTIALGSDFYYNGNLIAQAGSSVSGTVLEVSKAKHGSMKGKLNIRFTQIVTPYVIQIPISAVIKTEDNTGVLIGGTKFDVVKDYISTIPNLYCIGRNGQHKYNNMDHSMLSGIEAVNVIKGSLDKNILWLVNTEKEYHEVKS